jgi:hypothetical protein
MIVNEILESTKELLKARIIADVAVGLGYSAVELDDGSCGLAATLRNEVSDCCTLVKRAGELAGCPASSLGEMILSTDVLESAVGLATINACINKELKSNVASPLETLATGKDDVVGMIGYFKPLVEPIRQRCKQLYVFERNPSGKESVYPDWAANVLLAQCNIIIISGTTLINKTLDHLLELCQGTVVILGPSTPMSPILKKRGVSFVFGITVRDASKVLKIVSQAGGARAFGKAVEKINLKL